jgi:hypothetical protein
MKTRIIPGMILLLFAMSCATPKLSNLERGRYGYKTYNNPENILNVSVSTYPIPDPPKKDPEKLKTFFDLRDSIPHTYLRVIGPKAANIKEVIDAMKEPLSKETVETPDPEKRDLDATKIQVRFIFSNIKRYYNDAVFMHPNTRMEFLTTTVSTQSSLFSVLSIDKIENEYEMIDMGTLQRNQDVNFSTKLALEGGLGTGLEKGGTSTENQGGNGSTGNTQNVYDENGKVIGTTATNDANSTSNANTTSNKASVNANVTGKAEVQYANNESIKEALQLRLKRMKTGFSFSPKSITISQRSVPLSDITDNVFVTATLKAKKANIEYARSAVVRFTNLFDAANKANPFSKMKYDEFKVTYCPCQTAEDIEFHIYYEGAIRSVKNQCRGKNILEYDDKVVFYNFQSKKPDSSDIKIAKEDYCHRTFDVIAKFDTGNDDEYRLYYKKGEEREVLLYDIHSPRQFAIWIASLLDQQDPAMMQSGTEFYFVGLTNQEKIFLSKSSFTEDDMKKLLTIKQFTFREHSQ